MGRAVTAGQLEKYGSVCICSMQEEEKAMSLSEYIEEKVELLHELYYNHVTKETFADCTNEIQVDNRARTIIFGVRKRCMAN